MTSQLAPLLSLRWRMVRSGRARLGFLAVAGAVPVLCLVAAVAARLAPDAFRPDVVLLAPTILVSVALLAVLAPLVAGGGNELFPDDHLVAYPVTAHTVYLASLALTPLNLAWTMQLVGLVGLASYISARGELAPLSVLTFLAYVVLVTVAAQAVAWSVVGLRQRRRGRRLTWAVAGALALFCAVVVLTGNVGSVLDRSPTTLVVIGALNGSTGAWTSWTLSTAALLALAALAHITGRHACTWALRQPRDAAHRFDTGVLTRRPGRTGGRAQLLVTDRAGVWRSPSLRRGMLVLGVLPGLVALAAGLDWPSLVLLPALVAAGAGLLFGVNAFCLDGPGALWLASIPGRPGVTFWCKTQVVAEVCLVPVILTVLAGSLGAGAQPTTSEAVALLGCAATALLLVVATCMELSVNRPHRADLRGPRDSPAPPGVMAVYSARLAVSTTLTAILFSALAGLEDWRWPAAAAVALCLRSVRRLLRTATSWADPAVRARVVTTVAGG